jgi:hypothetical protein
VNPAAQAVVYVGMSAHDDKRRVRVLKRTIKKAGNRKRRQHLKNTLRDDPASAADADFNFGRDSSASLNGADRPPIP